MAPALRELSVSVRPYLSAVVLAAFFAGALVRDGWAERGVSLAQGLASQLTLAGPPSIAASVYTPSLAGVAGLREIPYRYGALIDEAYRQAFRACDRRPHTRGCGDGPNRLNALIELPSGALFMEAHLNLDLAGSTAACVPKRAGFEPRFSDCATLFDYAAAPDWTLDSLRAHHKKIFLENERVPFVTIPLPEEGVNADARAFPDKTRVGLGDVGVVFYRDRFTPVIVGNAGPARQSLAGSLALFEALGVSRCAAWADEEKSVCAKPIPHGLGGVVAVVLFPGSRMGGLAPESVVARVEREAYDRLSRIVGRHVAAANGLEAGGGGGAQPQ